ncbi:MAG: hypothetical protein D6738_07720 [Acidobacteria bacterium]|nr:MAG: hypothetical protein D6738_07720 [Acidobacteriota bacterium]
MELPMTSIPRHRPAVLALAALLGAAAPAAAAPEPAGPIAATLFRQHRVVLVAPDTGTIVSAPTGIGPTGLVHVDDALLVANRGTGRAPASSLTEIALPGGAPRSTRFVCENCAPTSLAIDGTGRLWLVAQAHRAVSWLDRPWEAPAGTVLVPWGWPTELAVLPGGGPLVVGMRATDELAVIDLPPERPRRLRLDLGPGQLALRPGAAEVWVGTQQGRVFVLDRDALAGRAEPEVVRTRAQVLDLAFAAGGELLLVASASVPGLVVVDPATREVLAVRPYSEVVTRIAAEPGGRRVALAFDGRPEIAIVRVGRDGALDELRRLDLGGEPEEMLWLPAPGGTPAAREE